MLAPTLTKTQVTFVLPRLMSSMPNFEFVKLERRGTNDRVGLITLNRPEAMNALCIPLMADLTKALSYMDNDKTIGAVVLTGNKKSFAAGADIKGMLSQNYAQILQSYQTHWSIMSKIRKPIVAAINGYVLAGGLELALMCDIVYAGQGVVIGLPEVNIGTIPGGVIHKLNGIVGKSLANKIIFSGVPISATEAKEAGLVYKVFPTEEVVDKAIEDTDIIASYSKSIVQMCKQATNTAHETILSEGLDTERRIFYSTFATQDQKEGMTAFVEERKPKWTDT